MNSSSSGVAISRVFSPTVVLLGTFSLSFGAWMLSGGDNSILSGYKNKAQFQVGGFLIIGLWMICILVAFHAGRFLTTRSSSSRRTSKKRQSSQVASSPDDKNRIARRNRAFLAVLLLISYIGTVYITAKAIGTVDIQQAFSSRQGNALKETLEQSAGIESLRYASIPAAASAFYLKAEKQIGKGFVLVSILPLIVVALFSSRLALIMTLVLTGTVFSLQTPVRKIRLRTGAIAIAVLALLLTLLNYLRNAPYYERLGIDSPLEMNYYQIVSYLATPTQVGMASAKDILEHTSSFSCSPVFAINAVIPTFLKQAKDERCTSSYSTSVEVLPNFTTNGAFADLYVSGGWLTWVLALIVIFTAGMLYGYLENRSWIHHLGCGTVVYCLAELWRIYLFGQGIVIFILLSISVAYVVSTFYMRIYSQTKVHTSHYSGRNHGEIHHSVMSGQMGVPPFQNSVLD